MKSLIDKSKVIVCVGTGGVGKTTIAASLGVYAAKMGLNVLVLTIDPAKRLAQALGLSSHNTGDVLVPGQNFSGQLYAGLIDPQTSFNEFVLANALDSESADKILNNTLYKQLSTNLSGSQEFTSLDRLYRSVQSNKYDLVILDTPPAQNAMDFFSAPEKLYALFQKSITRWFIADSKDKSFFSKIINKGTLTVLSALEKLTGAGFIQELADFFTSIQGVQEVITQRSLEVNELLTDVHSQFLLVSAFDKVKLSEAELIYRKLNKFGFHLYGVIINRCFDLWQGVEPELQELGSKFNAFYTSTNLQVEKLHQQIGNGPELIKVRNFNEEVFGLSGLDLIADSFEISSVKE